MCSIVPTTHSYEKPRQKIASRKGSALAVGGSSVVSVAYPVKQIRNTVA